ncbi:hypothetical protein PYCC9005_003933 [Savitreella phatthalungensis]
MIIDAGLTVLLLAAAADAQGSSSSTRGAAARSFSTNPAQTRSGSAASYSPTYRFNGYSTPSSWEATRIANYSQPAISKTYAKAYTAVSSLFANVSTTASFPNWTPTPAASAVSGGPTPDAFSQLWINAAPLNLTRGLYNSTVSPTPVATAALIRPPPLQFPSNDTLRTPADFIFGVAGSASQVEGAVADGKAPSVMDMLYTLFGGKTVDNYVIGSHYYLYKQDINRLAAMGIKDYYFTLSWTRIMPFALPGTPVNQEAIQHYSDVIDYCLSKGIRPMVAITHFDTPLQFYGGGGKAFIPSFISGPQPYGAGFGLNLAYQNSTFVDAYVNYAKIVLAHYADRVPRWITFNEPQIGSINGVAVDHVIKAHAQVVHYYRETLNGTGKMSMKMGITPAVPQNPSNGSHVLAAQTFTDIYVNPFLYPLTLGLDYPSSYKQAIHDYVPLSQADLAYMNNTMDFIALDTYSVPQLTPATTDFASCAADNTTANPLYRFPICLRTNYTTQTGWQIGYTPDATSQNVVFAPQFLRAQLSYVWNTFKKPVLIAEFGLPIPPPAGGLVKPVQYNTPQSEYLIGYLREMLKSISLDGVNVMGAFAWSFMSTWEFTTYTEYGLQYVNLTKGADPTLPRNFRRSMFDAVDYIESRRN